MGIFRTEDKMEIFTRELKPVKRVKWKLQD